jgi:hypothetical protein
VLRAVHDAHAALTQLGDDPIVTDDLSDHAPASLALSSNVIAC